MAKFITLQKRYLIYAGLFVVLVCVSVWGAGALKSSLTSTDPTQVEPELKILSLEFDPKMTVRDMNYGGEEFKGLQTINKDTFSISAIVQNMTENIVSEIPIQLTISAIENKSQSLSKEGKIPTLEPGASARITFENIKALGDGKGESPTAGQHEMILAIKANHEGGISQNSEARIIFNVDTSVKK